jgi:hypothetical protein
MSSIASIWLAVKACDRTQRRRVTIIDCAVRDPWRSTARPPDTRIAGRKFACDGRALTQQRLVV